MKSNLIPSQWPKSWQNHPQFKAVLKIYQSLSEKSYKVLLAGGCVRDGLLGQSPKDFDLATNAHPEEIKKIFPKVISVGEAFGILKVESENQYIELATFRKDGDYKNGRQPESVSFSNEKEDALRRDFTINALFYDLERAEVIDFVDGQIDLANKIIRTVGTPDLRFQEDHLRLLRALRFSLQLEGFKIEETTWASMLRLSSLLLKVSGERLKEELEKIWLTQKDFSSLLKSLKLLEELHFFEVFFSSFSLPFLSLPIDRQKAIKKNFNNNTLDDSWFFFWLQIQKFKPLSSATDSKNREGINRDPRESNNEMDFEMDSKVFEKYFERFRLPIQLKQKLFKNLFWFLYPKTSMLPFGQMIESGFDKNWLKGLQIYSIWTASPLHSELYQAVLAQVTKNNFIAPKPLIKAEDLKEKLKGKALGEALRFLYWSQLEEKFFSKEEGISLLNKV